ncbi:hypothetical protein INT43_001709 [Umbelopsis isabellina]|uniref:Uncharacterized protein n=1 Tax=Mortierella isabellina TaxID=91625 RepID=A0A8H7PRH7_MORIS|nr:hypothetical protein INT43_001709 [Umbelopsis isabellina]
MAQHVEKSGQRNFHYEDGRDQVTVVVHEVNRSLLLDVAFGHFIWPSSIVMAEYVWKYRHQFADSTVLEVGAGTSLPSLILAKFYASGNCNLVVTDTQSVLSNIRRNFALNGILDNGPRTCIRELQWGIFGEGGIDELLETAASQCFYEIKWILGSDTFYDPKGADAFADFEKLLVTVAYVIHRYNKNAKFITAYQERSSKRSIQHLLDKWQLSCRLIPKTSFDFDDTRYIEAADEMEDDIDDSEPAIRIHSGELASVFLLEIYAG